MKGPAVLLVEDTTPEPSPAQAILTARGCAITRAITGRQALSFATQNNFDLILIDSDIPGIDGFRVAGILRQTHSLGTQVPIILFAAAAPAGPDQPFNDVLLKPVTQEALERVVEKWWR